MIGGDIESRSTAFHQICLSIWFIGTIRHKSTFYFFDPQPFLNGRFRKMLMIMFFVFSYRVVMNRRHIERPHGVL